MKLNMLLGNFFCGVWQTESAVCKYAHYWVRYTTSRTESATDLQLGTTNWILDTKHFNVGVSDDVLSTPGHFVYTGKRWRARRPSVCHRAIHVSECSLQLIISTCCFNYLTSVGNKEKCLMF